MSFKRVAKKPRAPRPAFKGVFKTVLRVIPTREDFLLSEIAFSDSVIAKNRDISLARAL